MHLSLFELLLIFVGGIFILGIQLFLSTRKNRIMGLLFPLMSLIYTIYMFINSDFFSDLSSNMVAYMFIGQNIPTFILLLIYIVCRIRMNKNRESQ